MHFRIKFFRISMKIEKKSSEFDENFEFKNELSNVKNSQ